MNYKNPDYGRPVKVKELNSSGEWEEQPEIYKFHCWGVDHQEFESGPGNYMVAIIEASNGQIQLPYAKVVRFIDVNLQEK